MVTQRLSCHGNPSCDQPQQLLIEFGTGKIFACALSSSSNWNEGNHALSPTNKTESISRLNSLFSIFPKHRSEFLTVFFSSQYPKVRWPSWFAIHSWFCLWIFYWSTMQKPSFMAVACIPGITPIHNLFHFDWTKTITLYVDIYSSVVLVKTKT